MIEKYDLLLKKATKHFLISTIAKYRTYIECYRMDIYIYMPYYFVLNNSVLLHVYDKRDSYVSLSYRLEIIEFL